MIIRLFFWIILFFIIYSYFGYPLLLLLIRGISKISRRRNDTHPANDPEPAVTLVIPAYNEVECLKEKIQNCLELNYPSDKLIFIWVTDGSTDGSTEILRGYPAFKVLHNPERMGKTHAINRAMEAVQTPYVVFTDANTMLNPSAIRILMKYFTHPKAGCVAGEKRIVTDSRQRAVSKGEGIYWRYESWLKKLESSTGSVLGAAGELFAIRSHLYIPLADEIILDDFMISMNIATKGYSVEYAPEAAGAEKASISIREEIKRKERIAIGGIQFLSQKLSLLNPFRYGLLSLKYISHKVMRWTIIPFGFILFLLLNVLIVWVPSLSQGVFIILLIIQTLFYMMVFVGAILDRFSSSHNIFLIPYYFFIMHYAVIRGIFKYLKGNYSVLWPKSKRE